MADFLFLCFLFGRLAGCLRASSALLRTHAPLLKPLDLKWSKLSTDSTLQNVKIMNFPMSAHMFIPKLELNSVWSEAN